jgi:pimeloyl-ACP methyl ester carboxylesterase
MNAPLRPPALPAALVQTIGYFLPRLMFLNARIAPQLHWGDVTRALSGFDPDLVDLASGAFWEEWLRRFETLGQEYAEAADRASHPSSRRSFHRSAAACFHWAEFMYFDDATRKTALRQELRRHFLASLGSGAETAQRHRFTYGDRDYATLCFLPADRRDGAPLPLVLFSNGLDSVTEVEPLSLAEPFLERGIAVVLFEGPGQGLHLGQVPLATQMETFVARLVDELRQDPVLDIGRMGFVGVSFGGHIALRVAWAMPDAFRCVVNYSGGPTVAPYEGLPRRLKQDFAFAFGSAPEHMPVLLRSIALDPIPGGTRHPPLLSIHGALDDIFPLSGVRGHLPETPGLHDLVVHPAEAHVCLNHLHSNAQNMADWAAHHLTPKGTKA